jgi:hypothetical protein
MAADPSPQALVARIRSIIANEIEDIEHAAALDDFTLADLAALCTEVERQAAEIARLRAECEMLAGLWLARAGVVGKYGAEGATYVVCADRLRAALGGDPGQ